MGCGSDFFIHDVSLVSDQKAFTKERISRSTGIIEVMTPFLKSPPDQHPSSSSSVSTTGFSGMVPALEESDVVASGGGAGLLFSSIA